jgi:UDP-2-acetamido-3-amino-2,3-dideoxy-glucuronate N-acetyltransferase
MSIIIAEDFQHGSNFKHGNNVIVEPDVIVGDDVKLGNNVVLKSGTRFGSVIDFADYCCTTGACILGDHINARTGAIISKSVIVEDWAFIGPGIMTNHTKHVSHGRPNIPSVQYVTRIGFGSIVGSSSMLLAGVNIASNVIIGGGSVVVKDVKEPGIYVGNPVKRLGDVPKDYWVDGESVHYDFDPEILKKYLPNIILEADPHKNIAK